MLWFAFGCASPPPAPADTVFPASSSPTTTGVEPRPGRPEEPSAAEICEADPDCLGPAEASFAWVNDDSEPSGSASPGFLAPIASDYTGDGVPDALYLMDAGYGTAVLVAGPLDRDLLLPADAAATFRFPEPVAAGDVDADGVGDVWVRGPYGPMNLVHGPLSGEVLAMGADDRTLYPPALLLPDDLVYGSTSLDFARLYRGPFDGPLPEPFLTLTPIWGDPWGGTTSYDYDTWFQVLPGEAGPDLFFGATDGYMGICRWIPPGLDGVFDPWSAPELMAVDARFCEVELVPDQDGDGAEDLLLGSVLYAGPAVPGAFDTDPLAVGVPEYLGRVPDVNGDGVEDVLVRPFDGEVAIHTSGAGWLGNSPLQRYAWEGSIRNPPIGAPGLLLVPFTEALYVFPLPTGP